MIDAVEKQTGSEAVLATLEHSSCTFCDDGVLVRDVYKGNDAVVCANCGVPGAQVW
ncbi:HVO_A0556 family zinc finger protein [Natronobiforma cellulositropha]|uniref:HVO_A0556 family zinc finger protein n=1 Tax=Natronobiforma cellulositropha TaxID=1679076 RepID=UPI0021D5A1DF|nr:HVO_A0556 family zinc finger protein [Natronobiforma cellulositropha]